MLKHERVPVCGEKVRVYRNLNSGKISIVDKAGHVIQHASYVILSNATFRVQPAGREKVRRTRHKNVHAFVYGTFCDSMVHESPKMVLGERITYNPYKYDTFVRADNEKPVERAIFARIDKTGTIMGIGVKYA